MEQALLYKIHVSAEKIVWQKDVPGRAFTGATIFDMQAGDRSITRGPDGCGWLFIGDDLTWIHPDGTVERVRKPEPRI